MQFQVIIDNIEGLIQENKINADVDKIYGLIERISSKRPVSFYTEQINFQLIKIQYFKPIPRDPSFYLIKFY